MSGPMVSRLIAFLIFFYEAEGQSEANGDLNFSFLTSVPSDESSYAFNSRDSPKDSQQKENLFSKHKDHADVVSHEENGVDSFLFGEFPEKFVVSDNKTFVFRKCCHRNFLFDVDNLKCAPSVDDSRSWTNFLLSFGNSRKFRNESIPVFAGNFPMCDDPFVLSIKMVPSENFDVVELADIKEFCVDGSLKHPERIVILSCKNSDAFCSNHACFRKCCPIGESYGVSGRSCKKSGHPFRPEFYNLTTLDRENSVNWEQFGLYIGDGCGIKGKYLLEKGLGETSYLGVDGTLFVPMYEQRFSPDDFCVEYVTKANESGVESFLCFFKSYTHFENSPLQFFLLSLGFIVSCMFLLLTFFVYLLFPKNRNLHGKTLMCYIASLFSAYLFLAVVELKSEELSKNVCMYMGYILLFSFLSAFFWLNVMSFDIWKTFRTDRSVDKSKIHGRDFRFLGYSLYAWSFPFVITAACAVVDQSVAFPYPSLRPAMGEERCWFSKSTKGIYIFFIAPITLIIGTNVVFYVQTARKIWKVKTDVCKMEKQKTKKFSTNRDQFVINGKLFVVMGITWSLEVISFFAPHPIWYITDTANALHGVFIFVVFIMKKKVLQEIIHQLGFPIKKKRKKFSAASEKVSPTKTLPTHKTKTKSETGDSTTVPSEAAALRATT